MKELSTYAKRVLWAILEAAQDERVLTIPELAEKAGVSPGIIMDLVLAMEHDKLLELTVQPLVRVEFNEKAFKRSLQAAPAVPS